jgi:hypothetical protein
MKKLILCLTSPVVTAHAQTEDDYRRSLSHAEKGLNDIWNMRLNPTERDELRADERKWVVWKDKNDVGLRGPAAATDAFMGKLDGGIRPDAEFSFNAWAFAMKDALFGAGLGDQAAAENAIEKTRPLYISYVVARNTAEIKVITNGRADFMIPDPTPRLFADTYADKVLKEAVEHGRHWNGPPLTPQYIEEMQQTVFAYENIKLDPEKIANWLTSGGFKPRSVEDFRKKVKAAESDPKTFQAALEQAYSEAWVEDEVLKGNGEIPPPLRNVQLLRMKYASDPAAVKHLDTVDPTHQYLQFRPGIKQLVGPNVDWCTGEEIK